MASLLAYQRLMARNIIPRASTRANFWIRVGVYSFCTLFLLLATATVVKAQKEAKLAQSRAASQAQNLHTQETVITAYHNLKKRITNYAGQGIDVSQVSAAQPALAKALQTNDFAQVSLLLAAQNKSLDALLLRKQADDLQAAEAQAAEEAALAAAEANRGDLKGVLTDGTVPLVGATISLLQNDQLIASTTTDNSGAYTIHEDAGIYTLKVELSGYDTLTKDGIVITATQAFDPALALVKIPILTPTATPAPKPKSTATPKPATPKATAAPSSGDSTAYSTYTRTIVDGFTADIMTFDLASGHIKVATDTANDTDCADGCSVLSVQNFVLRNNGFAGINGTYFCPTAYSTCAGQTNSFYWKVLNSRLGTVINENNGLGEQDPFIGFDSSGHATFYQHWSDYAHSGANAFAGISCKPILVSGGNYAVNDNDLDDKQRTAKVGRGAIGLKGQTLYVVVVQAATVGDIGHVMADLGMDNALNIDGGGSTAIQYNGAYKRGPGRSVPNAMVFIEH